MATKNPSSSPRTPNASKRARLAASTTPASVVTSSNLLNAYFAKKILRENILPPPFPADTRAQVESLLASMDDSGRVNVARFLDAQQKASPIVARESITKGLGRLLEKINAAAQEKGVPFYVCIVGAKKAGAANRWVSFYGPPPAPNRANTPEVDSIPKAQLYQGQGVFLLRDYTPIVALITCNEHETAAVQKQFCPDPTQRLIIPLPEFGITCQRLGKIAGTWIVHCTSGQGENRAQQTANALIAGFGKKLRAIIGVGIAFGVGLDEQEKGDVLVLEDAYDYEMIKKAKKTEPRGKHYPASLLLLQRLKLIDGENKKNPYWPKIHFGTIASGNTLVDNKKYRDMLVKMAGAGTQGGEMEAIGISFAAELPKIDWIIVKGICDWGDSKKNAPGVNKDKDQETAANNAACVVYEALSLGPLYPQDVPPEKRTVEKYHIRKQKIEQIAENQLMEISGCYSTLDKDLFASSSSNTSATQTTPEGVNVLDALNAWVRNPGATPFFVLLGEYGMGKTITCQQFTKLLQEQLKTAPTATPLPLYFDLRNVSGLDSRVPTLAQTIEECIERGWLDHNGPATVSLSALYDTIEMRPAVFIFDGLDEVLSRLSETDGQIFTRNLLKVFEDMENRRKNKNLSVASVKILISCRTQFFRTLRDQQNHLTGQERIDNSAKTWTTMLLLPVNDEQITFYLKGIFPNEDISKIKETIASIHNLKDLSQRPITLRWITELLPEIEKDRMEGKTINGATLYHHMALRWLERDAGKQHIEKEHKMKLATHLAAYLWKEKQNALPATEIETWFLKWLQSDEDIAIHYTNLHRDKLKEDLRNCTFLSRQDNKYGSDFRFAHTSLLEYFLAVHLHNSLQNDDSAAWDDLTPSRETLVFLIQQNQTSPTHIREKVRMTLLKYLAQSQGNLAARQSWAELYLLAPDAWKAETLDISGLDFGRRTFTGLRLSTFRTDNANLAETRWKNCTFTHSSWRGANCRQIVFENIEGAEADFSGANLHAGRWKKVTIQKQDFSDANYKELQKSTCGNRDQLPSEEVPLLQHWCLQREGHEGWVIACSLSADRQLLLTGSEDGTARLWNIHGECLRVLKGHVDRVVACSLSADGQVLLTGSSDCTARLWNAKGECLHVLKEHTNEVRACSLSADGKLLLTGSLDGTARLWNAKGECLHTLKGHTDGIRACSLSADGKLLLTGSYDRTARLWNAKGECLDILKGHTDGVRACSLSADGKLLLTGSLDGSARLWSVQGKCLHVLKGHTGEVVSCSLSADGQFLLTGSADHTARLWNTKGESLCILKEDIGWIFACSLSPDGQLLLTGSSACTARLWNAKGECLYVLKGISRGHSGWVFVSSLSADGQHLLTGAYDCTTRLWNAKGESLHTLKGHTGAVYSGSLSADGQRILTGSTDWTARLWNTQGKCLHVLEGHKGCVRACSLSLDGQLLLTGSSDRTARLWNAKGECRHVFEGHIGWVNACSLNADGKFLLTGSSDCTARLWNARGKCLSILKGHEDRVVACFLSPDGQLLLTGSSDNTARIWNTQGKCLHVLKGHTGGVLSCSLSADGQFLFTGSSDGTARMWNIEGECRYIFRGFDTPVGACRISADGQTLIIASSTRVRHWRRDGEGWGCFLDLCPATRTRVYLDAQTQTLKIDGPDWPFWQLHNVVDTSVRNRLGETIADFGPLAHEQLANGADWHFIPAPV